MGRPGTPEEVARTVLWLASASASYITAAIVPASGGR
jgi:meso-butanediol dehydrogenase / (S,S)-butanediol dehydrogenase / diacetyl reductase